MTPLMRPDLSESEGQHGRSVLTPERSIVLVEPRIVTRMRVHRMLEQAAPNSTVAAFAAPEEVTVDKCPEPAAVVLSSGVLAGSVQCLEPVLVRPHTRLILVVRTLDRHRLHTAARLPVDAILREGDLSVRSLVDTLTAHRRDMVAVSRDALRQLLSLAADPDGASPQRPMLTARELEALRLIAIGSSNRQIAKAMHITEHGAKRHVANVLAKLGCQNRTMAAALAIRLGLVKLEAEERR